MRSRTPALVLPVLLVVAGCALANAGDVASTRSGPAEPTPAAQLAASVRDGARQVGVTRPLVITATHGTLSTVTATGPGGDPLAGTLNAERTRWSSVSLEFDATYTVRATGANADGRRAVPLLTTFSTVTPDAMLRVDRIRPSNGQTVGIAMPISVYFDRPVTDRAAVERRLSVEPSVPTVGSFHWISDEQVNWRPKEFWVPGTIVTVRSALRGVDAGVGLFGASDAASTFRIGRNQQVYGDVRTHTLTLYVDNKPIRRMPASYGRPEYPTQHGIHVVSAKHETERMRSDTWGGPEEGEPGFYDQVLPLAVRISANGEFVHVNAATVSQQGRANVSHGCVNLSPADGRFFYDWVQIGDPVNIVGSSRPLTKADGDIADWTIPWDEYVEGSALYP